MKGSLYNYPRLVVLLIILIVAAGTNAVRNMPILEDPYLKGRFAVIVTQFPGASAERVEALVTEPIESKMREEAEIKVITSTSRAGVSSITMELKDEVSDTEKALSRLRDKLGEVTNLPAGALPPLFDDKRIYAFTKIMGLVWERATPPNYAVLGRYAKELENRVANLTGTGFVRIQGLPKEEISVTISDSDLAALNMSVEDVAARIFAGDPKGSAGQLSSQNLQMVVEVDGAFETLDRIREIPLAYSLEGRAVRVGDIASINRTIADPPGVLSVINGRSGVLVSAYMQEDSRVDVWSETLNAELQQFRATLPDGVSLEVVFNQAEYTTDRLSGLVGNLIVGIMIVFIVLLISLGWRASVIAGSILPLASLSALALLYMNGYRIQQMTVTGLIVGLGIMVDNAIVITEGIQARLLRGEGRMQAVAKTVRRLWLPLLGSTVTTVIAFLPILLMPGPAGEFVGGISAAVIASLVASYVIAFAIISAVAGKLLKYSEKQDNPHKEARLWWRDGINATWLSTWFERSVSNALQRPLRTMMMASLLPVAGILLATTLTEQFFPPSDRDQFEIQVTMPAESSIHETRRAVQVANELLLSDERIASAHWTAGGSFPKFYYNLMINKDAVPNYAGAMVTARSLDDMDALIVDYQSLLDERLPSAEVLVKNLEQGPPFDAPIEMRVYGPELEVLRTVGEQLRGVLVNVPNVTHARTSLEVGRPQVTLDVNEDEAALVGLSLRDVASQVKGALDGVVGGSVLEETEEVPVRVRTRRDLAEDIDDLRALELIPRRGAMAEDGSYLGTPLSALAETRLEPAISQITRRGGIRVNTVQGFIRNNVLAETVLQDLQQRLEIADIQIPPGYRVEFGGESEKRNEAVGKLMGTAGLLAVMMVIAIVLTYDSFRLATITFVAAIQAAGLGMLSLVIGGYPLGFVVIVGVMGLIGLSINATIVILSELKSSEKAREGDLPSIVKGVMSTGRHITSTTLTTVGGFMPLMLTSAKFWPPFAFAIAGGAFLSMIVSFYFAPAAFLWFAKRRSFAGKKANLASQDNSSAPIKTNASHSAPAE